MQNNDHEISLSPLKITLVYLIVAALWIIFSDRTLELLLPNLQKLSTFQTYKGLLYVLLTSIGLYFLIKIYSNQLTQKEEELKKEQELTSKLFERIPIMITSYDPDLNKFQINKEFEKVTGWQNEQLENINLMEECFPDRDLRKKVSEFMSNPGIGWKEFKMSSKSGESIPTSWTNIRLTDNTSVGIGIDMSEIKSSQAKIRKSQKLLKKIFESLKSSLIILNYESRTIIDCNKSTEELFGYDREKLIGASTKKLHLNEKSYKEFDEMGTKSLEEKGVFQTEFKMKKKDGTIFNSGHTVTLVYDEDGEIDKVVSVIEDITERKNYEQKLKQRNAFIETTLENLPIGVAVNTIDDGQVTLMNKRFCEIYGWPKEVLKDVDSFFEHVYPDQNYRSKIKHQVMKDIQSGNPEPMEWSNITITTQEGETKIVNNKAIPLYEQNLMISTVIDFTQQKKLQQKLRESEEKYRHIFKDNPEPMWIYNPDTMEFAEVNQAAIKHYGYSEKEFLNMTLADIRPPEFIEKMKNAIEKHRSEKSYSGEWRHLTKDGSLIHVEVTASNVQYKDKTYRLALMHDITEQKRMQQRIIESVIEGGNRERKRIAHELHDGLGQYLVASSMNLESVKKDIQQLSDKREQQFQTGLSLLKNALSETRSIAYNLMPKAIADYGLISAVKNLIQNLQKSTDIIFHFDHNKEELQLKDQAEINIYRIIQELVSNAVRHADCSTISIKLQVKRNSVKLIIEDDGKGMQLEEKHGNKGLGLRSIRTRVSNLQGTIDIKSQPGEGMTTTIIIPHLQTLLK